MAGTRDGEAGLPPNSPHAGSQDVSASASSNGRTAEPVAEFFVHARGLVEQGAKVGARTRVWAFAHVLPGATIGADCNICDHVLIEGKAKLGDRVTIKSGVQIWDGVVIEDDVFVGPNATFTNDLFPRSKHYGEASKTVLRAGASIGANATVLPGIIIGRNAMVGAGSVVTKNVPPNALVVGNPARITGYVSSSASARLATRDLETPDITKVAGVKIHKLPVVADLRGNLSVAEFDQHLPFIPKRYFIVFDVPSQEVRGEHAHRKLQQFLVCVKGSCNVVVDDGSNREEIVLDRPDVGVYVPPMVWATQYKYSPDGVLLVFASESYDPADYIRDYDEYIEAVKQLQ